MFTKVAHKCMKITMLCSINKQKKLLLSLKNLQTFFKPFKKNLILRFGIQLLFTEFVFKKINQRIPI